MLEGLAARVGPARLIAQLAPRCRITTLQARGEYGVIQGAANDAEIFAAYAQSGTWARPVAARLLAFFAAPQAGTYVDVGANIGLTTLPVAQAYPGVQVIALEPEPTNFDHLMVNVRANSPPGTVRCHQQAAFSYAGTMPFEVATDNLGDHRLRLGPAAPGALGEHRRATISVEAIPLDALERTFTTPLAVKIDTQGAEPFVLAGAPKTLARTGLLICEFWPYAMHRLGGDPDAVIAALVEHFPHASLGPGPAQPMATAARTLAQFALRHRADAAVQMDVVAWR